MIQALINQYVQNQEGEEYVNDNIPTYGTCINNQDDIDELCYFDEIFSELGIDCVVSPSPMPINPSMPPMIISSEEALYIMPSDLLI